MMSDTADLHEQYAAEVVRLHEFFEDWFAARADRAFEEFSDSLDERFIIVTPAGEVLNRTDIIDVVAAAYGSGSVEIWIERPTIRHVGAALVGTYEEHQRRGEVTSARIASVVMQPSNDTPGGWSWIAVHETWLEEPA